MVTSPLYLLNKRTQSKGTSFNLKQLLRTIVTITIVIIRDWYFFNGFLVTIIIQNSKLCYDDSAKRVGVSAVAAALSEDSTANRILTPPLLMESPVDYHSCIFRSWIHLGRGRITDPLVFLLPPLLPARIQSPFPLASSPPLPCSHTAQSLFTNPHIN